MKIAIFILSHFKKDDVLYHYEWHKKIGYDVKVIWQTEDRINHPDIMTVDIPGKMVVATKMRLYCHYAKKYDYDYYVFLDCDAFILHKDFWDINCWNINIRYILGFFCI